MAKISFNQLLEVIRGRIKGLVIRRRPDGVFILSGVPRYKKNGGTPKQKVHWQRVSDAAHDAKALARIHPIYVRLAAEPEDRAKWLSAYNFAFADCMKPPVIQHIERREGCIRVRATDNIEVIRVRVTVQDDAGKILERGDAARAEGDWWEFLSSPEEATVLAGAWDLADELYQPESVSALPVSPLDVLHVDIFRKCKSWAGIYGLDAPLIPCSLL